MAGGLQAIAKLERADPEAARVLARLATWEWLADEADAIRPTVMKALYAQAVDRSVDTRRALVRTYISKRMEGAPESELDDVLHHAAYLTAIEAHIVKSDDFDPKEHPRDKATGRFVSILQGVARGGRAFADAWTRPDDPRSTQRQAYNRMKAGGTLLEQLSVPGGTATKLVGEIGPQAERVLGPGIRRNAYRYRGTERTPDAELRRDMSQVSDSTPFAGSQHVPPALAHALITDPANRAKITGVSPLAHAMRARSDGSDYRRVDLRTASPDTVALHLRADMATNYLIKKLPNLKDAEASLASGRVPPSRGVLIDREGDVVSEAVGFNGDHYLPFDLKNLGKLTGGQYARTRMSGGPSTEDVYTGLVTGARAMTVVSNAGVFTIEFDPDLRGGKRYADSARAMVNRYGKLLEAIGGEELARVDIDPAERNRIKYKAYEDSDFDHDRGEKLYKDRLKVAMQRSRLQNPDEFDAEVERKMAAELDRVPGNTKASKDYIARLRLDVTTEVMDAQRGAAVQMHRLDGEGYYAALRSLKQEFPQYVRNVSYEELGAYEESRGLRRSGVAPRKTYRGKDAAHVAPGAALPAGFDDRYGQKGGTEQAKPEEKEGDVRREASWKPGAAAAVTTGEADNPALAEVAGNGVAGALMETEVTAAAWTLSRLLLKAPAPKGFDPDVQGGEETKMVPEEYVHHVLSDPRGLAKKVLSGEVDKQKMLEGLDAWVDMHSSSTALADAHPQVVEAAEHIKTALLMREPFAPPASNMALAEPDPGDPRPQPFPEIVKLGSRTEKYDQWLKPRATDDPKLVALVEAGPEAVKNTIISTIKARKLLQADPDAQKRHEEDLGRLQLAWSFLHARDLAERAKAYLPAVSPGKAPPPSAAGVTKSLTLAGVRSLLPAGHPLLELTEE